jgi:hypothetical protein
LTTVKCQCCGAEVEIPREIDEAALKWMARTEAQRKTMQDLRAKDPDYGKPEVHDIQDGGIIYNGKLIVQADDIRVERQKSGAWKGWANIGYRNIKKAGLLAGTTFRTPRPGDYMIELGDNGPRSRVTPPRLDEGAGPRKYRVLFTGIGELNLPSNLGDKKREAI